MCLTRFWTVPSVQTETDICAFGHRLLGTLLFVSCQMTSFGLQESDKQTGTEIVLKLIFKCIPRTRRVQPRLLDIPRRFPSEAPVVYRRASPLVVAKQTAEARRALSVPRDAQALLQRSLTGSFCNYVSRRCFDTMPRTRRGAPSNQPIGCVRAVNPEMKRCINHRWPPSACLRFIWSCAVAQVSLARPCRRSRPAYRLCPPRRFCLFIPKGV